jgi:predicted SAM-dependent methyltransferase
MEDTKLNLGCSIYKIDGFINIDIDPKVNPDLAIDIKEISKYFKENSVDFIYASHFFEHLKYEEALITMAHCAQILKPFRNLIIVVPDYSKCSNMSVEDSERIILGQGSHKTIFNSLRITEMLEKSGFNCVYEIYKTPHN